MNQNKNGWFATGPVALIALTLMSAAPAMGDTGWQPELVPSEAGAFHKPQDAIRLYIPPDVPIETLQRLSLEVDDIDVTAMITRDGDHAVYTPDQPLDWGMHRLRLVEYAEDGSIIERGFWTIEVRKSAAFRESGLDVNASLEVSQRVADNNLSMPPGRTQATGSMTIQGRLADEEWRSEITLPLIYNSLNNNRKLDAGDFLLDWERRSLQARLGHHPIVPESMVMSGFSRRGVSATYTSPVNGASVTGFAMRGNQVNGFQDGLGLNDSQNRIEGGVVSLYPLQGGGNSLELSAVYLSGQAPEAGAGVAGDDVSTGGDAWSARADGLMLDNRLRLRGEYARTRYDFDGSGGESAERDHGYSFLATFKPWLDKQVDGSYIDWNLGVEYRHLGTFFRSPANPGATSGRKMARLFTDLTWGEWGVQATLARESDNVDDLLILPQIRTQHGALSANYTPTPEYDDQGEPITGWLGQPSYAVFGNIQTQKTQRVATPDPGDLVDTQTRIAGLNASFSYSDWSWGLNHTWTRFYDDSLATGTPTTNETRNMSTGLNASFTLSDNYTVSPRISWDQTKYYDFGYTDKGVLWGLSIDAAFIPGELSGQLNYDENRSWVTDASADNKTRHLGLSLTWIALEANQNRPGVTWMLTGDYNDYSDSISGSNDTDSYQVFLKALIGWSASH